MTTPAPLSSIVALVRAGALDHAWSLFRAAGHDLRDDDPAALTLMGRLLKDSAARAIGEERRILYLRAADAYRRSAGLRPGSYPLINAATLSLAGGREDQARMLAEHVLTHLEQHPDEPETPYYHAATRAEALLLLGRGDEAAAALAEAIGAAPRAWEDHATTLRQFALILDAQGGDASWLDAHRPPGSLHFGGHMSFDPKVVRREHLDRRIAAVLEEERVGFGYGALAAGADIIIAEALLERGAELHAVLPGGVESFASVSVDPLGRAWRRRFDAILSRAETVRTVRPFGTPPDRMTIELADEIAMGAAVMNARRLESRALQLLVLDQGSSASPDAANGHRRWAEAGWRQRIITAPREALPAGPPPPLPTKPHARLALLALGLGPETGSPGERLGELAALLGRLPPASLSPYFTGNQVILAYREAADAARTAAAIVRAMSEGTPLAIGGHYGIVDPIEDPFSGGQRLSGEPVELAGAAAASAPPGSICVTEDFAAALAASNIGDVCSELIGELEAGDGRAPVALYALKPRPSPLPADEAR
jgi:tetratricopeptide (TPR) repeat protein